MTFIAAPRREYDFRTNDAVADEQEVNSRISYIKATLQAPCSPAANFLGRAFHEKFPGATVLLYGSGGSIMKAARPTDVLFDFYVITPSYRTAIRSFFSRFANVVLPPNVYFLKVETPEGLLRAKYAVVSEKAFERLLSERTFHSYFWARFAQPFRVIGGNANDISKMARLSAKATEVFFKRSLPLAQADGKTEEMWIDAVWRAGLSASYRAELRAENPDRADALLASYGDWCQKVTDRRILRRASLAGKKRRRAAQFAWRLRAAQGAILSVLRLLKATFTFQGGADYIAWKIRRHTGIDVPVHSWERRHAFIASPLLAFRYYRMRNAFQRRTNR